MNNFPPNISIKDQLWLLIILQLVQRIISLHSYIVSQPCIKATKRIIYMVLLGALWGRYSICLLDRHIFLTATPNDAICCDLPRCEKVRE